MPEVRGPASYQLERETKLFTVLVLKIKLSSFSLKLLIRYPYLKYSFTRQTSTKYE